MEQATAVVAAEIVQRATANGNSKANVQPGKKEFSWVTTMDEIREEQTDWLWRNRIALGRMSLIGGDPGTGTSAHDECRSEEHRRP